MHLSWSKSGLPLSSGLSLHLASVDRWTEGDYVCTAANGVGQPAMTSVSVGVLCE